MSFVLRPKLHDSCRPSLAQPIGIWDQLERFECVCIREVIGETHKETLVGVAFGQSDMDG